ncbi:30S ribosomal protein S4e, partial [Candidatus Bathyarchaeota archaeon]|nr:30S ribosomal protein S4e [Candidatus Bathyarchaeota archaeon]
MGKKGGSKHLKRLPAPTFWPIHKKEFKWVIKPKPGPHMKDRSFPLLLILREILGLAKNRKEAKRILSENHVKIDGVIRKKDTFSIGLMDVLDIPIIKKSYRILPMRRRGLGLHVIDGEEKDFKLCKIMNKTVVKGGISQLNLHDGRNILLRKSDPEKITEDILKTHDVLKIDVPDSQILDHLSFDVGVFAIVENGKNIGRWGEIIDIEKKEALRPSIVTLKDSNDDQFKTILDYVFPVGKTEPWISLP